MLSKRQKLVGLSVGGRPAADDCPLKQIQLKTPHRFILMGTPEVYGYVVACEVSNADDPTSNPPRYRDGIDCSSSQGSNYSI